MMEISQLSVDEATVPSSPKSSGGGLVPSAAKHFASGFATGIRKGFPADDTNCVICSPENGTGAAVEAATRQDYLEKKNSDPGDISGSTKVTPAWRIDRFFVPSLSVQRLAASVIGRRQDPLRWRHPDEAAADESVPAGTFAPEDLSILFGADSIEGHYRRIREALLVARGLYGAEGLRAVGFEFRLVQCERHGHCHRGSCRSTNEMGEAKNDDGRNGRDKSDSPLVESASICHSCVTRLYHIQSSTMISTDNRAKFIADGDMYEEVARLVQENAHEIMATDGNLEWVTVCDDGTKGSTVQALVGSARQLLSAKNTSMLTPPRGRESETRVIAEASSILPIQDDHATHVRDDLRMEPREPSVMSPKARPILLIVTGKGKVRAGVFSRQHLITSGLEPATAVPMVREARRRGMRVVMLDPNARGDKIGLDTITQSVLTLFGDGGPGRALDDDLLSSHQPAESDSRVVGNPVYILAYSAGGGHLVRYLINAANSFIDRVRAIAFIDSTHNIRWVRHDPRLSSLLESPSCVYVRSVDARRDGIEASKYQAGEVVDTDSHWRRRFGALKTFSAGAACHGTATWAAHAQIWEHFDCVGGLSDGSQLRHSQVQETGRYVQ